MNLFDNVRLKEDLPDEGLRAGDVGVIVEVYTRPEPAYEVEFSDDDGITRALLALKPSQVDPA